MAYPSTSHHVEKTPTGEFAIVCCEWEIDRHGEKDCRVYTLGPYPTHSQALAAVTASPQP